MKKLLFTAFFASLLFSCSEDEDEQIENNSQSFVIDGQSYTMEDGLVFDYGSNGSHYNYDFIIADGILDVSSETTNAEILFYIELFSPTTNSFSPGIFNFVDENNATLEDIEGQHFFSYGDLNYLQDDSEYFQIVGGTIEVVENSSLNYSFSVNVQAQKLIENSQEEFEVSGSPQTLAFSFSSTFQYFDERE